MFISPPPYHYDQPQQALCVQTQPLCGLIDFKTLTEIFLSGGFRSLASVSVP